MRLLRIDIHSPAAATVAARYGLTVTPSFALFDAGGRERLRRVGSPPSRADLDLALPPSL